MLNIPMLLLLLVPFSVKPDMTIPLAVERIVSSETRNDSLAAISAIEHAAPPLPFIDDIQTTATQFHIPAALIAAIIQEESGFNAWAERSERAYAHNRKVQRGARHWSNTHHGIPSTRTELEDRSRSMGPMQVMGEVARNQGFHDRYLSTLFIPHNSITQGGVLLRHLLDRYRHDTLSAISAYNLGSAKRHHGVFENARYVYRVAIAWRAYKKLFNNGLLQSQH